MPQKEKKPTVTVLYDAQEKSVRKEELAEGKKVPELVCNQIEVHPYLDQAKAIFKRHPSTTMILKRARYPIRYLQLKALYSFLAVRR